MSTPSITNGYQSFVKLLITNVYGIVAPSYFQAVTSGTATTAFLTSMVSKAPSSFDPGLVPSPPWTSLHTMTRGRCLYQTGGTSWGASWRQG